MTRPTKEEVSLKTNELLKRGDNCFEDVFMQLYEWYHQECMTMESEDNKMYVKDSINYELISLDDPILTWKVCTEDPDYEQLLGNSIIYRKRKKPPIPRLTKEQAEYIRAAMAVETYKYNVTADIFKDIWPEE